MMLDKPPFEESLDFVVSRFESCGKTISRQVAGQLVQKIDNIPYYIQQLGFEVFRLIDDAKRNVVESLTEKKSSLEKVYDFDLMEEGGHITGWLVAGENAKAFGEKIEQYVSETEYPMIFAVGDGNHSLATAKACYEEIIRHPF